MPRKTALEVLERIRRGGAWGQQTLDAQTRKNGLDGRDSALAARLVYGVLQNMTLCDFYIDAFARGKLEPKVRDILRLGVYQLAFMDKIPGHAAVSQSVELCRRAGYARAAGLVNAVLRRVDENRDHLPEVPGRGTAEYLSTLYSHPLWLTEELMALRGYDGAEAVLRADNTPPPVYIQTNTLKTTPEDLQKALGAKMYDAVPGCLTLDTGDIARMPEFLAGHFYVQDPAAHMAVLAADIKPGMKVLDACAAPGGKSFAAAIAMKNDGVVHARDMIDGKINLIMDGADRMGLTCIECETMDARETEPGDYDVVLADVPCSGLGVIRKKPDIRWREKRHMDMLVPLQGHILTAVSRAVKPGGKLVYSTCTWRQRENGGVTGAFLAGHDDFQKLWERTFWPDTDGTDGFYICLMERKSVI